MHVGYALLTLFPGRVGGSETNARGVLEQFSEGRGPDRVTVLANRHVMSAYAAYGRGPVQLHQVASYRPGDGDLTRLLAMSAARVAPRRAARDVPAGLDVLHFPVTVPIPRPSVPHVVTLFDVQHHDLPAFFSRAERTYRRWAYDGAARGADVVVATSAFSAQRIAACVGIERERIEVVHMGIDGERFSHAPTRADEQLEAELELPDRFVVYPANLWPHKNHAGLLEAFARVPDDGLALVLTGQTYGRAGGLCAQAQRLGIERRVRHLGHLPEAQVPALLRRARALVFPSLYEGFGAPPLEAMASGLPVAVSNRASLPEICGSAALSFDPSSPDETAAAIAKVTSDEGLRTRLRGAGLERVAGFTWRAAAERHAAIYERAAATAGGSRGS